MKQTLLLNYGYKANQTRTTRMFGFYVDVPKDKRKSNLTTRPTRHDNGICPTWMQLCHVVK
jgi:hypothetical protein